MQIKLEKLLTFVNTLRRIYSSLVLLPQDIYRLLGESENKQTNKPSITFSTPHAAELAGLWLSHTTWLLKKRASLGYSELLEAQIQYKLDSYFKVVRLLMIRRQIKDKGTQYFQTLSDLGTCGESISRPLCGYRSPQVVDQQCL